LINMYK